ncbi:MAG: hypothetical protein HC903_01015 [Methylacidiphilales bacterium]|nr:hypothetical protein [Candidatus Methylacidiphilales bacterium]NJR16503.1 hypothetical protein [Calothrix sp. CSU_2_0]
MNIIHNDTFPVNITVQIRKNIYSAELYFDEKAHISYYHDISEAEDYYIKLLVSEVTPKYKHKGKYFLLLDLRNVPKVGMVIMPLDKINELYTFAKNTDNESLIANTSI